MMVKVLGLALVALLAIAPIAMAAEIEGKIKMIDTSDRTIVLDDGTKVSVADGVSMDTLKEGTDVKVSYEERDGKNVANSVEVK
jgi:Cu/Ag efflux protein CusF